MERMTTDKALALLEKVVEERGESYRYNDGAIPGEDCVYAVKLASGKAAPSCGVGLAVQLWHPATFQRLAKEEFQRGGDGVAAMFERVGIPLDERAEVLLHEFQSRQDQGVNYGACLNAAKAALEQYDMALAARS